jgi:hypothetical protein
MVFGVVMLTAACASAPNLQTGPSTTVNGEGSRDVAALECTGGTTGFSRSFSGNVQGDPTPEQAVAGEVAHATGGIARYLSPPPRWQVSRSSDGVTFTAAHVLLHAFRTPSGGWVVDSGQYCR